MSTASVSTDIDIDFADRNAALDPLLSISASLINANGKESRHPSGVYFQDIPVNPLTDNASLEYQRAAELGYFKIDFLNNSLYENVRDEEHLVELMSTEPDWSMLECREIVGMLAHIHSHFGTVQAIVPRSIQDLALVLALIRPGKQKLIGLPRAEIEAQIWNHDTTEGYFFKKSHAISYAVSIVVQLNLLVEETAKQLEEAEAETDLIG